MPLPKYRLNKLNLYRYLARHNMSVWEFALEHSFNVVSVRKWASQEMRVYPGPAARRKLMIATGLSFDELFEEVEDA